MQEYQKRNDIKKTMHRYRSEPQQEQSRNISHKRGNQESAPSRTNKENVSLKNKKLN